MKQGINIDFDISSIDSVVIEPTKLNDAHFKNISLSEKNKIELMYSCLKESKRNRVKFMPLYSVNIYCGDKVEEYLIAKEYVKYKGVSYSISEKLYHLIENEYKK